MVKYLGPAFTLLMCVGSFAMGVFFALQGWQVGAQIGVLSMAAMSVISGYVVYKRDWPLTWKPLLGL